MGDPVEAHAVAGLQLVPIARDGPFDDLVVIVGQGADQHLQLLFGETAASHVALVDGSRRQIGGHPGDTVLRLRASHSRQSRTDDGQRPFPSNHVMPLPRSKSIVPQFKFGGVAYPTPPGVVRYAPPSGTNLRTEAKVIPL